MKRSAYLVPVLPALALLAGCQAQEESADRISAAAAVMEIPVTTASDEALDFFTQGQHALDMGRFQDARDLFNRAVETDAQFTMAYVNLSIAASSGQDYMQNLEAAEASMATTSEGERLLVEINRTYVDVDVAKRLELAKRLAEAYPASPRAWITLADIQTGLDEIEDARASMKAALDLDPNFTLTHITFGFSYLFNEPKDFAKGLEHMQRVVELEPNEANAHVNLGDAYRAQKMLEEARDAYAAAVVLDPSSGLALSKKGHAETFLSNYDAARTDFDRAVEVARENLKVAYANFGAFVSAYAGDAEAAVAELGQIYDSIEEYGVPEDQLIGARLNVLTAQAMIAMYHGLFDTAHRALELRSQYVRENAEIIGDDDFSQAQEANIVLWDGFLAAYKGDFDAAQSKAEEHAGLVEPQTDPRKMEGYHNLMGFIELRAGNHQQAVEHYRQGNLNNIMIKHHYAIALEAVGETEEAQRLFTEVAEWNFNSAAYACIRSEAVRKTS